MPEMGGRGLTDFYGGGIDKRPAPWYSKNRKRTLKIE
jgi:hypothetical protein